MSDNLNLPTPRIFRIGGATVVENESTMNLNNEQVREMLKSTYPEVVHAKIVERADDQHRVVEFIPQPGKKG